MNRYVLYSTIWMLFSEAAYVHYKIEIKLFYFVILLNLFILLWTWDLKLNRSHIYILLYLWLSGLFAVLFGPDHIGAWLQQVIGISITSIYFYIFIREQRLRLEELFRTYARVAFWVSALGLIITPIVSLWRGEFIPVQSLMKEPAHFATIMLPAFYYYGVNALRHGRDRLSAVVLLAAIVLSGSAIAFLGLLLCLILFFRQRIAYLIAAPILVALLGGLIYSADPHFSLRVDDTINAVALRDVTGTNLSTFALLANAYVAEQAFMERPITGYGIGGHVIAHEKYIGSVIGVESFFYDNTSESNATDANSLFLRATSELGLIGLVLIAYFLIKFSVLRASVYSDLSAAMIPYFALKLLREGHWFSPEMYFFVWMYVFVWYAARSTPINTPEMKAAH